MWLQGEEGKRSSLSGTVPPFPPLLGLHVTPPGRGARLTRPGDSPAVHCAHVFPNTSSRAKRPGRPNSNGRVWSRESFLAGPGRDSGELMLQKPSFPDGVGGKCLQAKFGVRAAGLCDFPEPSAVKQQWHCPGTLSSAWTYLPGVCVGGSISTEELKDTLCTSLEEEPGPSFNHCTTVS